MAIVNSSLTFTTTSQSLWKPGKATDLRIDTGDTLLWNPGEYTKPFDTGTFLGFGASATFYAGAKFGLLAYANLGTGGSFDASYDIDIAVNIPSAVLAGANITFTYNYSDVKVSNAQIDSIGFGNSTDPDIRIGAGLDLIVQMGIGFRDITLHTFWKDYKYDAVSIVSIDETISLLSVTADDPLFEIPLSDEITLIGRLPTGANVSATSSGSPIVEGTGFSTTKFLELEADLDALLVKLLDKIPLPPVKAVAKFLGEVVFAEHSFDLNDYASFIPKDKIKFNFTLLDITANAGLVITEDVKLDITGPDGVTPYLKVTLTSEDGTVKTGYLGLEGQTQTQLTLKAPANGIGVETITAEYEIVEAEFTHGVGLGINASITITVLEGNLSGAWVPSALRFSFGPLAQVEFPEGGLNIALGNFYEDSFKLADDAFNTATDSYDVFYSDVFPTGWDQNRPTAELELFAFAQQFLENSNATRAAYSESGYENVKIASGTQSPNFSGTPSTLYVWIGFTDNTVTLGRNNESLTAIDLTNGTASAGLVVKTVDFSVDGLDYSKGVILGRSLDIGRFDSYDQSNGTIQFAYNGKNLTTNQSLNFNGSALGDVLVMFGDDADYFDGGAHGSQHDTFVGDFAKYNPNTQIKWDLMQAIVEGGIDLQLSNGSVTIKNVEAFAIRTGSAEDEIVTGVFEDYVDTGAGNDFVELTTDRKRDEIKLGDGDDVVVKQFANVGGATLNFGDSDNLFGGKGYDSLYLTTADKGLRYNILDVANGMAAFNLFEGISANASHAALETLRQTYFSLYPNLENRVLEDYANALGSPYLYLMNGELGNGYASVFTDIEAINILDGGYTADDLAMFMGGTRYEGGAGTDTLLADFTAFEAVSGIDNRGGVLIDLNKAASYYGETIFTGFERLYVIGTTASDVIEGGMLDDYIDGGEGNDVLYGGNDTVADTILGGAGRDVVKWAVDGLDLIDGGADDDILFIEADGTESSALKVALFDSSGAFSSPLEWFYIVDSNAILLEALSILGAAQTDGSIGFDWFDAGAYAMFSDFEAINIKGSALQSDLLFFMNGTRYEGGEGADDIDTFVADFSDQSVGIQFNLTRSDSVGTAEGETLTNGVFVSGIERAILKAGSANDLLIGGAYNDHFDGGDGADILMGNEGSNTLIGGAGKDVFYHMAHGTDTVAGGDGDDYLIIGVDGQATNNSVLSLRDASGANIGQDLSDLQDSDALMFVAERYKAQMVSGTYDFGSGSVTFTGIEALDFAGSNEFIDVALFLGGEGYLGGERADGRLERDTFVGDFRSETTDLFFTSRGIGAEASAVGQGTSISGFERFVVTLGSGDDEVFGGQFSDYVKGGDGDDFFDGGKGSDQFDGGAGDDVYHYSGGLDRAHLGEGDHDTLVVGGLTGPEALDNPILFGVANVSGNLPINSGAIVLSNQFGDLTVSDFNGLLAELEENDFNQGILYSNGELGFDGVTGLGIEHLEISGSTKNDVLVGAKGASVLMGGAGDDFLGAYSADADFLSGGIGSDTYVLMGKAGGTKVIGGEYDTGSHVHFTDFTQSQLSFFDEGNYLSVVADDGAGGSMRVIIRDYFANNSPMGLNFLFSTSDSMGFSYTPTFTQGTTRTVGSSFAGTSGDDVLTSATANDDSYEGREGTDLFEGSLGADLMDGGIGFDGVSYANSAERVAISLQNFTAEGGDADRDILISIEQVHGSDYDDVIDGNYSDNTLFGGRGDDALGGGEGSDQIYGGEGRDSVDGEGDDDLVSGEEGDDEVYGGAGDDRVMGGDGDDMVYGEQGNDVLEGGLGQDYLEGGEGDDFHLYLGGFDTFDGGAGTDTTSFAEAEFAVQVDLAAQTVVTTRQEVLGTEPELSIATLISVENAIGSAFADRLVGDAGDNILNGGTGDDTLVGGAGFDVLHGGGGFDTVDYGAEGGTGGITVDLWGTVLLAGGQAVVDSFGDSDLLFEIENIIGTALNDNIYGSYDANVLDGGAGDDILYGLYGDDIIDGGDGNDFIFGNGLTASDEETDDDILRGGAGNDLVQGGYGSDHLDGGAGDDALFGEDGDDFLFGGTGTDTLDGGNGFNIADYRTTTQGIVFDATAAQVTGGEVGTDTLTNIALVLGGLGNDTVIGNADDNHYGYFGGLDSVALGGGLDRLTFSFYAGAVDIDLSASGAQARGNGTAELAAGGLVDLVNFTGVEIIEGSDFADRFKGATQTLNAFSGGKGADIIEGSANAANLLDGGEGDDVFIGFIETASGTDTVLGGGDGFDTVDFSGHGSGVTYSLTNGDGNDVLEGIEGLIGSNHADILTGSQDDDTFSSRLGDDTVHGLSGDDLFVYTGGSDTYYGGTGSDTIDFSSYGAGLLFAYGTVFSNGVPQAPDLENAGTADEIAFFDSIENYIGTDFNDRFLGSSEDEMFADGLGDDIVWGEAGNDLFTYAGGFDTWDGGGGIDTANFINFGAAVDVNLRTQAVQTSDSAQLDSAAYRSIGLLSAIETVFGTVHDDRLIGSETVQNVLMGGLGNDWIEGSYLDDVLDGGDGIDTISYEALVGAVTIDLAITRRQDTGGAGKDTLTGFENVFGTGYGDIIYGDDGDNLLAGGDGMDFVDGRGGNDTLAFYDGYDSLTGGDGYDMLDLSHYYFAVKADLSRGIFQTSSNHDITLGSLTDLGVLNTIEGIKGSAQRDHLIGDGQDNLLEGGSAEDILDGGDGADAASYASSYAAVNVNLTTGAAQGADADGDTLIAIEDLIGSAHSDMLRGDAGDNRLAGQDGDDRLYGEDGDDTLIGGAGSDILRGGAGDDGLDGGDGDDDLKGGAGADVLLAGAGNDSLLGENGEDSLEGGDGDDSLFGGSDNDELSGGDGNDILDGGFGDDVLSGGQGNDQIDGGAGIDTIDYSHASGRIVISLIGGFTTGAEGRDTILNIERVTGSDDNDVITGSAEANVLKGGSGNDVLRGKGGADDLRGGAGDDRIFGDDQDDLVSGGIGDDTIKTYDGIDEVLAGDGADVVRLGDGDDFVIGGAGNDRLFGNNGFDVLEGDEGDDRIEGGRGRDEINGGAGDDALRGDSGGDILYGGAGDDTLFGGTNADTFLFGNNAEEGRDRIKDWEDGLDVLDLTDFDFTSFSQILALSSNLGTTNMKIDFGTAHSITIENFRVEDFDQSDVIFIF